MSPRRRRWLAALAAAASLGRTGSTRAAAGERNAARNVVDYPAITGPRPFDFPRDHGAHPRYRTEWWYATGWVRGARGDERGIQVTFFRSRPGVAERSPSPFAARELLFAHAAIADSRVGRLEHDERAARAGLGLAGSSEATTDVHIGDWRFVLERDGARERYRTSLQARGFAFELEMRPTQPLLLQGEAGYSRKGPAPQQASYYYSRPHLAVSGRVEAGGATDSVTGEAWLDHEWSSEVMAADAQGWDWIGLNLDDGGAIMAFRMRGQDGRPIWAAATWRRADGGVRTYRPEAIAFEPLEHWRSPRTDARYPIAFRVRLDDLAFELVPLMPDQELDSRMSVGTVYWEGAVRATRGGRPFGRGYLELTGYWRRLAI